MTQKKGIKRRRKRKSASVWLLAAVGAVMIAGGYFLDTAMRSVPAAATSNLRICAVMSANQSAVYTAKGSASDWFTLTNTGAKQETLTGFQVRRASEWNDIYELPGITLEAGESIRVYCDGMEASVGEYHADFTLLASGDTLELLDGNGTLVQILEVPSMQKNMVYSVDSQGTWKITNALTMTETESDCPVRIWEIMAANATYAAPDGECYDYIELHNTSAQAFSLSGYYLSDDVSAPTRWEFPDVTIAGNGYLVVYCSGISSKDVNFLQADFKLSADGEYAILSAPSGQPVDSAQYPAMAKDTAYSYCDGEFVSDIAPTPNDSNDRYGAANAANAVLSQNTTGVFISEIMTSTGKQDYDWIEIYNSTGQNVDISGWGLSDKSSSPRKWQFPSGTVITPYSYMGVYMSGTEGTHGNMLCAGFSLSVDGGYTVSLSDADGQILDRVYVPRQYGEISYGRVLGQSGLYYFDTPTPGSVNVSGYAGKADMAQVSLEGGLYDTGDSLTIALTAPAGAKIYYTLDCSDPDQSKTLYTEPITVNATTILRTRVYMDGCIPSYIDTQTYLFGTSHTMYVVSLVSQEDNLFGSHGIYDQYELTNEVGGHIEIFAPDGSKTVISQGCGIKLHGDYSRSEGQKAFKIYARSEQGGGNQFNAPLIANRDYTSYSSFLLRAAGQDTNKAHMRDSVLTALASNTSVYYQETENCVVYINGEYWGHYYIREHVTAHSICQFEGWEGQEDDIDLVKANSNVFQGSNQTFADLLTWVKSNNTNTDAAYEHIASVIDIQNFIEYMAIEIYTGNTDTLNVKRYRNANADGLWRWVLYDLDWAFSVDTDSLNRWLTAGGMGNGGRTDNTLFIACMKNDTFRDQFLTYFGEKLATDFSAQNVLALFKARYNELQPEMPAQLERWGITQKAYQEALQDLEKRVSERVGLILTRAQKTFDFSDAEMEKYFGAAKAKMQEG